MRILLAVLLTVALIQLAPSPERHFQKQIGQVASAQSASTTRKVEPQKTVQSQPEKQVEEPEAPPIQEAPRQTPQPPIVLSDHEQWMQSAGVAKEDWPAVEYIFHQESTWRPAVINSEGCAGLGQRCPRSILETACPSWQTDVVCQIKHFGQYAQEYGGWQQAAAFKKCLGQCYSSRTQSTINKSEVWW